MKIFVVLIFLLVGCETMSDFHHAMSAPGSDGTPAPYDTLIKNVPRVITNPVDISSWLEIAGALATGIAGTIGAQKVHKKLTRKADTK